MTLQIGWLTLVVIVASALIYLKLAQIADILRENANDPDS